MPPTLQEIIAAALQGQQLESLQPQGPISGTEDLGIVGQGTRGLLRGLFDRIDQFQQAQEQLFGVADLATPQDAVNLSIGANPNAGTIESAGEFVGSALPDIIGGGAAIGSLGPGAFGGGARNAAIGEGLIGAGTEAISGGNPLLGAIGGATGGAIGASLPGNEIDSDFLGQIGRSNLAEDIVESPDLVAQLDLIKQKMQRKKALAFPPGAPRLKQEIQESIKLRNSSMDLVSQRQRLHQLEVQEAIEARQAEFSARQRLKIGQAGGRGLENVPSGPRLSKSAAAKLGNPGGRKTSPFSPTTFNKNDLTLTQARQQLSEARRVLKSVNEDVIEEVDSVLDSPNARTPEALMGDLRESLTTGEPLKFTEDVGEMFQRDASAFAREDKLRRYKLAARIMREAGIEGERKFTSNFERMSSKLDDEQLGAVLSQMESMSERQLLNFVDKVNGAC